MARTKLTAYLIKPEFSNVKEYTELLNDHIYTQYPLREILQIDGTIIVGQEQEVVPSWLNFLRLGTNQDIPNVSNKSTRAVIIIRENNHIFAFTHGHGRYMLREEVYERDFGLKVVLNTITPNDFKSIDAATLDISTVQTRSQTSRKAHLNTLNFDTVSELLRSASGISSDSRLGKIISGRDTFHFSYEFNNGFRDFREICNLLITAYQSESYTTHFSWIDNLKVIKSTQLKEQLNERLLETINRREEQDIYVGIPEIVNHTNNEVYSYTPKGETYDDLDITDYYNYLGEGNISFAQLDRHHIYSHIEAENIQNAKWKVYNCLVFEVIHDEVTYILTMGEWFKLDGEYAEEVEDYVKSIEDFHIEFPSCNIGESEQDYNTRVSDNGSNMINLDRKNITYDGSSIELCDILTDNYELIHVKKWYSSSTLSHLFSQGRISGQLLFSDRVFRESSIDKIIEVDPDYEQIINLDNYNASEMTIVFAIIDKDNRALHERLPFFSKLNMMQAAKHLQGLGYTVLKTQILQEVE